MAITDDARGDHCGTPKCRGKDWGSTASEIAVEKWLELMRMLKHILLGSLVMSCVMAGRALGDSIAYDNDVETSASAGFPQYAANQNWQGSLGMDFDVTAGYSSMSITRLGVFDAGYLSNLAGSTGNGVSVSIYNVSSGSIDGPTVMFNYSGGIASANIAGVPLTITQINGDAFVTLPTPIILGSGFQGSVVSVNDDNYNVGYYTTQSNAYTTLSNSPAIAFVGNSRYSGSDSGLPGSIDKGPADRYNAGTFAFTAVPLPQAILGSTVLFGWLAAFKLVRRKPFVG
jgi:hypothetical protein